MSSVDVSVLVEMVEGWRRSAGEMNETDDAVDAMDGCADELADAIDAAAEDAGPPAQPLPLAGVVVGPWHTDEGGDRVRYYQEKVNGVHDDLASCVDGLDWLDWLVWQPATLFPAPRATGTAATQTLAEAAADAHLRELGATLEGDAVPDACEVCTDSDAHWGEFRSAVADALCEALGTIVAPPTIQPLDVDSLTLTTATTGPDHRVIRRNGLSIGVIDVTQVDALQPDALNGQPVTMVVLSSGRRLPYAMGVVDLAWQLGISEVAQ